MQGGSLSLGQTKVVVLFTDDEAKIPEKKMDVLPTKKLQESQTARKTTTLPLRP